MEFLLGLFVGLALGGIALVCRTREQRKSFNAASEIIQTMENHSAGLKEKLRIAVIERDRLQIRKSISA